MAGATVEEMCTRDDTIERESLKEKACDRPRLAPAVRLSAACVRKGDWARHQRVAMLFIDVSTD